MSGENHGICKQINAEPNANSKFNFNVNPRYLVNHWLEI